MRTFIIFFAAVFAVVSLTCAEVMAGSERNRVPRITYVEPDNDTTIDLTGKSLLKFRWKSQPVPAGGREGFRFTVYKGFSYEVVAKENLGRDVFEADVPTDRFENGQVYSWQVKQRDAANRLWSRPDTWSFKVEKR